MYNRDCEQYALKLFYALKRGGLAVKNDLTKMIMARPEDVSACRNARLLDEVVPFFCGKLEISTDGYNREKSSEGDLVCNNFLDTLMVDETIDWQNITIQDLKDKIAIITGG